MNDRDSADALIRDAVLALTFLRATFGGVPRGPAEAPWQRVTVRPVEVRGQRVLQFSHFDGKKDVTHNYPTEEAGEPLAALLAVGFSGVHVTTEVEEIDVRITKKGKALVGRRKTDAGAGAIEPHNRVKDVPLP